MAREVPIPGEVVRLGQLLKLGGVIDGGGEVKTFLADHDVLVNGEPETPDGQKHQLVEIVAEHVQFLGGDAVEPTGVQPDKRSAPEPPPPVPGGDSDDVPF